MGTCPPGSGPPPRAPAAKHTCPRGQAPNPKTDALLPTRLRGPATAQARGVECHPRSDARARAHVRDGLRWTARDPYRDLLPPLMCAPTSPPEAPPPGAEGAWTDTALGVWGKGHTGFRSFPAPEQQVTATGWRGQRAAGKLPWASQRRTRPSCLASNWWPPGSLSSASIPQPHVRLLRRHLSPR